MNPIRTLLVEDEKLVLQDMLTIVNWEAAGFSVVGAAVNGKQGLTRFHDLKPQVVITDIKMPVMDGLSMLREIRKSNPRVIVMLLSAYEDFKYAKQAIQLDVVDYLIKAELTPSLMKAKLAKIQAMFTSHTNNEIQSAKAEIVELVNSISSNPADALNELERGLSSYDVELAFSELQPYIEQIIASQYQRIGFAERFQACPGKDLHALLCWAGEELDKLRILQRVEPVKHFSPCVANAVEYIHRHYPNPDLQIATIASSVGLSAGRLSVLFRQEMGQTVNEVITDIRIEAAKRLILKGGYKVYEIAELVGYKTSHYFSQVFYQHTGQQPNKYRREGKT